LNIYLRKNKTINWNKVQFKSPINKKEDEMSNVGKDGMCTPRLTGFNTPSKNSIDNDSY